MTQVAWTHSYTSTFPLIFSLQSEQPYAEPFNNLIKKWPMVRAAVSECKCDTLLCYVCCILGIPAVLARVVIYLE
jgi:hypothetical protein